MKFFIQFLLLLLLSTAVSAQQPAPAIHLEGRAKTKVLPDVAVIDFNIRSKGKLENEAMTKLSNASSQLVERLVGLGFSRDQIRITNFYIQEDYIYTEGNPRKIGYVASQSLSLRFPYEKERLAKLFGQLAAEKTEDLNISFGTEISESLEKKTRDQLIESAMADAREKAELIARAGRLSITGIGKIEYNAQDNQVYPPMMRTEVRMSKEASAPNIGSINANEIMLFERIVVTYLVQPQSSR